MGATSDGRDPSRIRAAISETAPGSPLDELRAQNGQLLATLGELTERQEELVRLNGELEQTNHGVMAMYAQLSDELEETNRGVVALYADLDDKTMQLREASEAKSRFLASVSHELRSPVNSVLGLARLLLDARSAPLADDQREPVELIVRSAGELLELVNQLLDLAKAESGRLQPSVGEVNLVGVFAELGAVLKPLVAPGVDLVIEAPEVEVMTTDRALLIGVLRNLLSNALKFTEAGTVRLSARARSPQEVEISVTDTGIGIAADDLGRVFEEFFQIRGPLQARHKGTGLGLAYSRRVAQTLGGDIEVTSELGVGSTFSVFLPIQWQAILGADTTARTFDAAAPPLVATAMVIDDDEGFRRILRGMLQGLVGRIVEASSGSQALELLAPVPGEAPTLGEAPIPGRPAGPGPGHGPGVPGTAPTHGDGDRVPDVIFLDLRMPDMDGADVLAHLGVDPRLRRIPVVIVTSAELDTATVALLERATALMAKSTVSVDSVRRVLAQVIQPGAPR